MQDKTDYKLYVLVVPTTRILTEKEYEDVHFKDKYVILETDRRSVKVGYYEVKQNLDEQNIEPSPEEKEILFKKLGSKYRNKINDGIAS